MPGASYRGRLIALTVETYHKTCRPCRGIFSGQIVFPFWCHCWHAIQVSYWPFSANTLLCDWSLCAVVNWDQRAARALHPEGWVAKNPLTTFLVASAMLDSTGQSYTWGSCISIFSRLCVWSSVCKVCLGEILLSSLVLFILGVRGEEAPCNLQPDAGEDDSWSN